MNVGDDAEVEEEDACDVIVVVIVDGENLRSEQSDVGAKAADEGHCNKWPINCALNDLQTI